MRGRTKAEEAQESRQMKKRNAKSGDNWTAGRSIGWSASGKLKKRKV